MRNLFSLDNPVMIFLSKIADLMILNIMVLICSIPVVTLGASFTAMYYVLLRIKRDETTYIVKDFFCAFKKNFKQATILWLIYLIVGAFIALDFYLMYHSGTTFSDYYKIMVFAIAIFVYFSMIWGFVLLSRYENTIRQTLINTFCVGFLNFFKTFVMGALPIIPIVLLIVYPVSTPVIILLGITLIGYMQATIFNKVFMKIENDIKD